MFHCVENSDLKIDNKVNPFKVALQMECYLKAFIVQENKSFIAGKKI
jgi:hypothetical protein